MPYHAVRAHGGLGGSRESHASFIASLARPDNVTEKVAIN